MVALTSETNNHALVVHKTRRTS